MADSRITKNANGGRYKYADMSQIHGWLEDNKISYYQYTTTEDGADFIYTVPIIEGKELPPRRGCRIVDATLVGIKNPAQEMGSAITYARRYSLLMAFGLATEDDDAQSLSRPKEEKKPEEPFSQPMPITPEQKVSILKEINRISESYSKEEFSVEAFLKFYKVDSIDNLPKNQYEKIMVTLNKYKDKE